MTAEHELPALPEKARRWLNEAKQQPLEALPADLIFARVLAEVSRRTSSTVAESTSADGSQSSAASPNAAAPIPPATTEAATKAIWNAIKAKGLAFVFGATVGGVVGYTAPRPHVPPLQTTNRQGPGVVSNGQSLQPAAELAAEHAAPLVPAPVIADEPGASPRRSASQGRAVHDGQNGATRTVESRWMPPAESQASSAGPRLDSAPVQTGPRAQQDVELEAERLLLARARVAIARGQHAAALQALDEYSARFLDGRLREEGAALRVLALAGSRQMDEARRAYAAFVDAYPRSMQTRALRRALTD